MKNNLKLFLKMKPENLYDNCFILKKIIRIWKTTKNDYSLWNKSNENVKSLNDNDDIALIKLKTLMMLVMSICCL